MSASAEPGGPDAKGGGAGLLCWLTSTCVAAQL